ncbi:amidase family protein, partial [Pseudomonas viridiflava]|uniref:amidase family protein n=1 Tax=Pseudomonas viridiflava TaxID=33069 RepID=UPI001F11EC56
IAYLARIYELNRPFEVYDDNGGFNAFVRIDAQEALSQARWADQWLNNPDDPRGPAPVLCGIALGCKDVIAICGRESKNGTRAFDTNVAHHDATIVARLREQGAVLLGHTICSEY